MDHKEINLDVKQTNRRHSTGRYGIKTNKTVKKHPIHTNDARNATEEIISTVEVDNTAPPATYAYQAAPVSVPVSLNKRKNWETVTNLKKSQDDINVGYRVAEIETYSTKSDYTDTGIAKLKMKLYQLDRAPPKNEQKTVIESGVNRKGHFVREKRKKGKKGVKNYNNSNSSSPNNRNNNNGRSRSDSGSGSENESTGEGSGEEDNDKYTLYVVQKRIKNPASIRSGPFYGCTCTRTCHCGKELGTRRRRDVAQDIAGLDINAL